MTSRTHAQEVEHARTALERHAGFEGARPESYRLATAFLDLCDARFCGARIAVQSFTGNAVLNFLHDRYQVQLEFAPDGTIAANLDRGTDEWDEDVGGFDGVAIPALLDERIKVVTAEPASSSNSSG